MNDQREHKIELFIIFNYFDIKWIKVKILQICEPL